MDFIEKCQEWFNEGEVDRIESEILSIPEEERTPLMISELGRVWVYRSLYRSQTYCGEKALELLVPLEKDLKDDHRYNYRMAMGYFILDRLYLAKTYFQKALELSPGDEDTIGYLEEIQLRMNLDSAPMSLIHRCGMLWVELIEKEKKIKEALEKGSFDEIKEELEESTSLLFQPNSLKFSLEDDKIKLTYTNTKDGINEVWVETFFKLSPDEGWAVEFIDSSIVEDHVELVNDDLMRRGVVPFRIMLPVETFKNRKACEKVGNKFLKEFEERFAGLGVLLYGEMYKKSFEAQLFALDLEELAAKLREYFEENNVDSVIAYSMYEDGEAVDLEDVVTGQKVNNVTYVGIPFDEDELEQIDERIGFIEEIEGLSILNCENIDNAIALTYSYKESVGHVFITAQEHGDTEEERLEAVNEIISSCDSNYFTEGEVEAISNSNKVLVLTHYGTEYAREDMFVVLGIMTTLLPSLIGVWDISTMCMHNGQWARDLVNYNALPLSQHLTSLHGCRIDEKSTRGYIYTYGGEKRGISDILLIGVNVEENNYPLTKLVSTVTAMEFDYMERGEDDDFYLAGYYGDGEPIGVKLISVEEAESMYPYIDELDIEYTEKVLVLVNSEEDLANGVYVNPSDNLHRLSDMVTSISKKETDTMRQLAQGTLEYLKAVCREAKDFQVQIKFPIRDLEDDNEYVWSELLEMREETFKVKILNEVIYNPEYQLGQEVEIKSGDVTDWSIKLGDDIIYPDTAFMLRHKGFYKADN